MLNMCNYSLLMNSYTNSSQITFFMTIYASQPPVNALFSHIYQSLCRIPIRPAEVNCTELVF